MKNDNAIELLKLATQLACAVMNQNSVHTVNQSKSIDVKAKGGVEVIFNDCLNTLKTHHKELTSE